MIFSDDYNFIFIKLQVNISFIFYKDKSWWASYEAGLENDSLDKKSL